MRKLRLQGFQDGVGECMEGQIGGKRGPEVLRTRHSGLAGALERDVVGTQNLGTPPHHHPHPVSGGVFLAPSLAR